MRKILSLVLAALMISALCLISASCGSNDKSDLNKIKKAGVLKVGMECNYAPFNWTQANNSEGAVALASGGYAAGYDVKMASIVAESLGVKLEIVKLEWEGLIDALNSGVIDCIIAGMSATEDRKLSIDFTNNYYTSELVLVVKKGSAYEGATSLSDFAGAKVTGQLGTFHYDVISQIQGVNKLDPMNDFPTMIIALQAGTIDAYVSERPGAVSAQAANSDLTFVEFDDGNGFSVSDDEVSVAVGVRKGSDLTTLINQTLANVSEQTRNQYMNEAVQNQPVSED